MTTTTTPATRAGASLSAEREAALAQFEPLARALARRATRVYRSTRLTHEDYEQEVRIVICRAVDVFAQDPPACTMYTWIDRAGWNACVALMRKDAAITDAAWRARAPLPQVASLDAPVTAGLPDAHQGDALAGLALEAGLTQVETAVLDARLQMVNGKPAPWHVVAGQVGVHPRTAARIYAGAVSKLRPLAHAS